jgi:hypothetical protein
VRFSTIQLSAGASDADLLRLIGVERRLLCPAGMARSWRAGLLLAGLLAPLGWPGAVRADETAIGVNVGAGSAVGFGGVTVTRAFLDAARVEVGAGWGYSGWQLSLMPKLALGSGPLRFITGMGVSLSVPTNPQLATGHPIWLHVDLAGIEYRSAEGLALSASVGATFGLGGGDLCAPPDGCDGQFLENVSGFVSPQARLGLAYWF